MLKFDTYIYQRGTEGGTRFCNVLFSVFRLFTIPLQYKLLSDPYFSRSFFPHSRQESFFSFDYKSYNSLPSARYYVLFFVVLSAFKHMFWVWNLLEVPITLPTAILLCFINYFFDTVNSLLYLYPDTTPTNHDETITRTMLLGGVVFCLGSAVEVFAEIQRRRFKRNRVNKGKPFTRGLFGWARHINYTGFALYRLGATTLSGGLLAGVIVSTAHFMDFFIRAIPVLDNYCSAKV